MLKDRLTSAARHVLKEYAVAETVYGKFRGPRGYSQFGEDVHLQSFYDRLAFDRGIVVRSGLIVDVGAFRPILLSNSYYFYRKGWNCINIDPSPGSMRLFNSIRPRDTNLEVAIAPEGDTGKFYLFGTPSVWNTMDAESAREATAKTGLLPREIEIPLRRLDSILDEYSGGKAFEVLFIDAEGIEVEILRSGNFEKYRPRVVLIEVNDLSVDEIATHPVVEYLAGYEYHLFSWINPNLMFIRGDSLLSNKVAVQKPRALTRSAA